MKKLMIAACAVAFAAAVQAAQYTWQAIDVTDGYDTGANCAAGTAYLFYSGSSDYTIQQLQAAIAAGTFLSDTEMNWTSLALDHTAIDSTGAFKKTSDEGLDGATGDSFYAVLVADHTYAYEGGADMGKVDPVQAYMTAAVTPAEVKDKGATPLMFGDKYNSLYDATSGSVWTAQTSAVPEPTSGLLLLLGVAGLALRRRRA